MKIASVLGYPVHIGTLSDLTGALEKGLNEGHHQHVVTLNPEMLMRGEQDSDFKDILKHANLILPDGAGVVWALKRHLKEVQRIPGIEFSEALIEKAAKSGESIALIGATTEVNKAVQDNLIKRYPSLKIAYTHHGFFKDENERYKTAQECAKSEPRYVFAAMGVPGQECWINEFKSLFAKPTAFLGIGGSFDIWSGLKKRAHPLFLKFNIEWLYRITSEPFRIKRVYKTLPFFVVKVLLYDH